MFSKHDTPYAAAAPVRVKCVAKYVSTRAESFEVVDGVVAVKASKLMAACALSDGEVCVVAHLKDADCHRLEEGQSYFIKHYNLTGRYGQKKMFFCPSTVIFKTSSVVVSSALDVMCHHAVCPPSKVYEDTCSAEGYYTLEGHVIRVFKTFKLSSGSLNYRIVSDSETILLPLRMFSKHDTPYAAAAPVRVKCVAKYVSTRAESFEVVDGVVAVKASKLMAACALSDGEVCVIAHLKDDDCHRLEEGQSYFIKHYNLTGRYRQKKTFFCPSTVIFKTSSVVVSSALDVMCHHAVCPPSKVYEDTCSAEGYYTLEGHVVRLSTTCLQDTKNGPVPVQHVTLQCGRSQIEAALWREAALSDIALGERRAITHLRVQRRGKLNSTTYTEVKKMDIAKAHIEVEVVGVSRKAETNETLFLTGEMEELTVPATVWSGDIDVVAEALPAKVSVLVEGGVVCALESALFNEM
ncbi:hypothetical protein SRHO_G00179460 [Serrasalmus rhombeus]